MRYFIIIIIIITISLMTVPAFAEETEGELIITREFSVGYNAASGNTRNNQVSGSFLFNRNKKHINETTLKANTYYSSTKRKMDAQKWYTMARYALSFGSNKKWYNFYRLEADHDRFADIDYRLVPVAGIGYWFYDTDALKLMAELGAGVEHTDYRSDIKNRTEAIITPRLFFEKQLFANSKISQNLYYYPIIEDFSLYRLRSETTLNVAMNEKLSLRLTLSDAYDSSPPKDTKKNDIRLTSSLVYSF